MKCAAILLFGVNLALAQGPADGAGETKSENKTEGKLISKVAGSVADTIVTSRDVKISHMVELAFKRKGFDEVEESSGKFSNVVSEALLEWMLFMEAQAIKTEEVENAEKLKLEQDLNSLIRGANEAGNYWKKLEVTAEEKRNFIDRKLKSKKLLQFRTQSSYVTVSDKDALSYYQQNKAKFGNSNFEKLKVNIKNYLEQQNAEVRLKEWLTILQKKYNVKHLGAKTS
jgi:hypothetical protein